MAGLNRVWPWEKRRAYNDLIGWQLSILATTYAVILGFMLYAVWSSFGEAELNVNLEANAVVDRAIKREGVRAVGAWPTREEGGSPHSTGC